MILRVLGLLLTAQLAASVAGAARVEILAGENYDLVASTSRGLRLRFREPDMVFRVGGRVHADAAFFDDDTSDLDPDVMLRRGRVYLSGKILDDFGFKIERELAPSRGEWRNLWVSYAPSNQIKFRAGNFIAPFGLEQMASSNVLTFMERSMSGTIGSSFQTGLRVDANGKLTGERSRHRYTFALAGVTDPMGQVSDDPRSATGGSNHDHHWSVVARASYAPIARRKLVVHFGGAAEYRDVLGGSDYRISSQLESNLGPRFLDTGAIADVDSAVSAGAEAAALFGPVLLQGEYQRAFLQADGGGDDPSFGGGYAQASWVVTGEHREYSRSSGVFGGLTPRSAWGAVELAARYSVLDLQDAGIAGGKAQTWTAGANWYIRSNLRLMFNYLKVDAERDGSGAADDPHIFQLRTALFF
jgi:phosphate-selective porin OprO and OprP